MALLGSHCSTAGGFVNALHRAASLKAECLQIFTRAPGMWRCRPFDDEEAARFRELFARHRWKHLLAHDIYLTNLAAVDDDIRHKSIETLAGERDRCARLGVTGLVVHMGAHLGRGVEAGLDRFAAGLDAVLERTEGNPVPILLESSAGQGTCLGTRFEDLARVIEGVRWPDAIGVCADTCHMFAAGYDLTTDEGFFETWASFERVLGIERLRAFHLNDSQKPLGCRVDRHEHVGQGCLGLGAFHRLLRDPRFAALPMVVETAEEDRFGHEYDLKVLRLLRASESVPETLPRFRRRAAKLFRKR